MHIFYMSFIAQYTSRIKTSVKGRYKGQIEGYRTRFELLVNSLILQIIPVIIQSVYTCSRKNNSSFGHLPCFNVTIYHEHCNLIKFIKMNVWMLKSFFQQIWWMKITFHSSFEFKFNDSSFRQRIAFACLIVFQINRWLHWGCKRVSHASCIIPNRSFHSILKRIKRQIAY